MEVTSNAENTELLEQLEARYQEAMRTGARWKLSADELLAAYAVGRRNFYFCELPSFSNLRDANLRAANLSAANLSAANLRAANLRDANLSFSNLSAANLRDANLSDANLSFSNLSDANLSDANLSDANLSFSNLSFSNLSDANLSDANLSDANLSAANLSAANLSRAQGLLDPVEFIEKNFEWTNEGLIAYKTFGSSYTPNPNWVLEPGSVLHEVVNPNRDVDCGCGINVAPLAWVNEQADGYKLDVWKVLIRPQWLAGVVVPFVTDGKIRASRVELIGIVE